MLRGDSSTPYLHHKPRIDSLALATELGTFRISSSAICEGLDIMIHNYDIIPFYDSNVPGQSQHHKALKAPTVGTANTAFYNTIKIAYKLYSTELPCR